MDPQHNPGDRSEETKQTEQGVATGCGAALATLGCTTMGVLPITFAAAVVLFIVILGVLRGCG